MEPRITRIETKIFARFQLFVAHLGTIGVEKFHRCITNKVGVNVHALYKNMKQKQKEKTHCIAVTDGVHKTVR